MEQQTPEDGINKVDVGEGIKVNIKWNLQVFCDVSDS